MKVITLEGCSGTGKTAQYEFLRGLFQPRKDVLFVVEKHYEPFRAAVNKWYETKGPSVPFTSDDVETFAKARAETFDRNFRRDDLSLVIFDRYYYTSAAYQANSELSSSEILRINREFGAPTPDVTLLLDCEPEVCFSRIAQRNAITGGHSVFSTSVKRIRELRQRYMGLLAENPEMVVIPTDREIGEIKREVLERTSYLFS